MRTVSCDDAYQAFELLCYEVSSEGVTVERRGQQVRELIGPTVVKMLNPQAYAPLHPYRKLNPWTMLAEFPWLMEGRRDIRWLQPYLPGAGMFSDDGMNWRAGYGPRLRAWPNDMETRTEDQVKRVIEQLTSDQWTRQAIISLWDPARDWIAGSKDYPCTQTIHFMCAPDGHLDVYVHMRSNDLFWGYSGVNCPNWCLLLQLVCGATGLEVGNYYHIADNMHVYERHFGAMGRVYAAPLGTMYDHVTWHYPQMGDNELHDLGQAVHAVEHFRQRHQGAMSPASLANFTGAFVEGYAVQWAHFMLLWDLVNDTPRRRDIEKRTGDQSLAIRLDHALHDVQPQMWRVAAAMWMVRSGYELNVSLGTQHMRDILGRAQADAYLGAMREDNPQS